MKDIIITPAFAGDSAGRKKHIQIFEVETTEKNENKILNYIQNRLGTQNIPQLADAKTKSNSRYEMREKPYGYEYVIHTFYNQRRDYSELSKILW